VKSSHESSSSIGQSRVEELTAECNKLRGEMSAYQGTITKLQADIETRIRDKVARDAEHERDMKAANQYDFALCSTPHHLAVSLCM
jgi:uncharacterized protein YeeX (DUF496 family)